MDVIDKILFDQIEDIKFWSGITNVKESPKPEWPTRMIFRFCVAAKACYEIIARDVELKDENVDKPDIFDPYSVFDLYYTDIAKWNDGHSRFKREFIQSGNLINCLNGAKRDFEDMLKEEVK